MGDKFLDLRPPDPSLEELMADGGKLLVIMVLREMPYAKYLKTNHWRDIRNRTWRLQRGVCAWRCQERIHDVHHVNYDNLGCEPAEDVIGLCRGHHINFHDKWALKVHLEGRKQFLKQ